MISPTCPGLTRTTTTRVDFTCGDRGTTDVDTAVILGRVVVFMQPACSGAAAAATALDAVLITWCAGEKVAGGNPPPPPRPHAKHSCGSTNDMQSGLFEGLSKPGRATPDESIGCYPLVHPSLAVVAPSLR